MNDERTCSHFPLAARSQVAATPCPRAKIGELRYRYLTSASSWSLDAADRGLGYGSISPFSADTLSSTWKRTSAGSNALDAFSNELTRVTVTRWPPFGHWRAFTWSHARPASTAIGSFASKIGMRTCSLPALGIGLRFHWLALRPLLFPFSPDSFSYDAALTSQISAVSRPIRKLKPIDEGSARWLAPRDSPASSSADAPSAPEPSSASSTSSSRGKSMPIM